MAFVLACGLLLPGVAAALMVVRGLGPFAAPYEPSSATVSRAGAARGRTLDEQVVEELSSTYETPMVMAVDSSILAAPYILATGREILPIGGFQGGIPSPSLAQLRRYVDSGQVRAFSSPGRATIRGSCGSTRIARRRPDRRRAAMARRRCTTAAADARQH